MFFSATLLRRVTIVFQSAKSQEINTMSFAIQNISPLHIHHADKQLTGCKILYLRPKVTLHFSVPNKSTLILILSKLNAAMSSQHMP